MNTRTDFPNILSFDVEEWFHLRRTEAVFPRAQWEALPARLPQALERVLERLAATGNRATFFWLGWCAERHPEWVGRVAAAGHEIACHGYAHEALDRLTPASFRLELTRTRALLEDLSGQAVVGFRAPSLSLGPATAWMLEVLVEEGFAYDSSLLATPIRVNRPRPTHRDRPAPHDAALAAAAMNGLLRRWQPWRWETPAGPIVELPLAVRPTLGVNLPFGGGIFFRCAPWWAVAPTLAAMNARGVPGVFYAHPWEFDPDSPLPPPWRERLAHGFRLSAGRAKYERLLRAFRFLPAREALEALPLT